MLDKMGSESLLLRVHDSTSIQKLKVNTLTSQHDLSIGTRFLHLCFAVRGQQSNTKQMYYSTLFKNLEEPALEIASVLCV